MTTFVIANGKMYSEELDIYLEPHHLGFPSNGIYWYITCAKTKESENYGTLDSVEEILLNARRTNNYLYNLTDSEYGRKICYVHGLPRISYRHESHDIYGFHSRAKFGSILKENGE